MAVLRLAVTHDPGGVARVEAGRLAGPAADLASGISFLLDGDVVRARHRLDALRRRADASPALALGARTGAAVTAALSGDDIEDEVMGLAEEAEALGVPWLAGFVGLVASLSGTGNGSALETIVAKDDAWGRPLAQLCAGLGYLRAGDERAVELLTDAADGFAAVDAPVLEAWALAGGALAASSAGVEAEPLAPAKRALAAARLSRARGPLFLAALSMAVADVPHGPIHLRLAETTGSEIGLRPDSFRPVAGDWAWPDGRAVAAGSLTVRCLGPLEASLGGDPLSLAEIKPRVRSLFRVLAMHAGRPVHRDRLIDWLWPGEGDLKIGTRNLQVAVSSLRQLLEPGVARGEATVVVRQDDTYQLCIDPEDCDLLQFESLVGSGRDLITTSTDVAGGASLLGRALDLYRGELLADEGATEWVTPERDRIRLLAAEASLLRGQALLREGALADAAAEAERGLRIDQYGDGLWRLLIDAAEAGGDRAAARRHRERYEAILRDLGV